MTQLVQDALYGVENHPIFSMDNQNSSEIKHISKATSSNSECEAYINFSNLLATKMWKVVTAGGRKFGVADDKVCIAMHKCRLDKELKTAWSNLLEFCKQTNTGKVGNILLLHIIRHVCEHMVKKRNMTDLPITPKQTVRELAMSNHDEQVLRYAAGYIPFALIKMFRRQKNEKAKALTSFLLSWKVDGDDSTNEELGSFLRYTRKWVEKISRGYIFQFNDQIYMFFRAMEYETRRNATKAALLVPNVCDMMMDKLNNNVHVQKMWDSIVQDKLPQETSQHLLSIVKKRWIKMRVSAFVRVYFEIRKMQDDKISRKGQKGTRKDLSSK